MSQQTEQKTEQKTVLLRRFRFDQETFSSSVKVLGKGTDLNTGQRVFIKMIRRVSDDVLADMEEHGSLQARRAAQVDSRVVPIIESGEEGGCLIIILPWIPERTASTWVRQQGAIDWRSAIKVGIQLLEVVQNLQSVDPIIIHGDIKPDNLFVFPDFSILLPDFGIAKNLRPDRDDTTNYFASAPYVEPERLKLLRVTRRSDTYSAIATTFFLVSGRPPYGVDSEGLPIFDELATMPLALPKPLVAFFVKALAFDPDCRYASPAETKAALIRVLQVSNQPAAIVTAPIAITSVRTIPPMLWAVYSLSVLLLAFFSFQSTCYLRARTVAKGLAADGDVVAAKLLLKDLHDFGALPSITDVLDRAIDMRGRRTDVDGQAAPTK